MHRGVILGDQLMGANTLAQIPDTHSASTVTANEFPLIRMNNHIVDRSLVNVVTLETAGTCIPDLDCPVFRTSHHPFPFTVEGDTGDIIRVAIEAHYRMGVGGFEVVELDRVVPPGGEVPLVGSDT